MRYTYLSRQKGYISPNNVLRQMDDLSIFNFQERAEVNRTCYSTASWPIIRELSIVQIKRFLKQAIRLSLRLRIWKQMTKKFLWIRLPDKFRQKIIVNRIGYGCLFTGMWIRNTRMAWERLIHTKTFHRYQVLGNISELSFLRYTSILSFVNRTSSHPQRVTRKSSVP